MAHTAITRVRRPGLALFLALISTALAMFYVGRWRRAFVYLAAFLLLLGIYIGGGYAGLRVIVLDLSYTAAYLTLTGLGMWDTFRIARLHRSGFDGGWTSRWPFLLALPVGFVVMVFLVRAFLAEPFRIPAAGAPVPVPRKRYEEGAQGGV